MTYLRQMRIELMRPQREADAREQARAEQARLRRAALKRAARDRLHLDAATLRVGRVRVLRLAAGLRQGLAALRHGARRLAVGAGLTRMGPVLSRAAALPRALAACIVGLLRAARRAVGDRLASIAMACARMARRRLAVGIVAALGTAGLAWASLPRPAPGPPPPAFGPAWEAGWIAVSRPLELFALSVPGAGGDQRYASERRAEGDGRRDTLRFGVLGGEGPFVAVSVQLRVTGMPLDPVEAAARLGGAPVSAMSAPMPMPSKFGAFAAIALAAGGKACLAFSRQIPYATLAVDGLYCGAAGVPVDRWMARCLIDRLDLVGGADPVLRGVFVAAERHRDFCGAGDLRAAGSRRAWFDSGAALPPLRAAIAPR
ncbi:hypothetical protein [Labrys wisconsinensis]|uniref:Uncharacterized protein n=1 Tax=Labrys wisconsinensis TaxID=425677 RepID=A0ABU0JHQ8_9HYPH|nr:hypothetical protein [Labrys wisconsinensis]MDQ0473809.1 hypothetical protein [Labrys wisconsinensis]